MRKLIPFVSLLVFLVGCDKEMNQMNALPLLVCQLIRIASSQEMVCWLLLSIQKKTRMAEPFIFRFTLK